MTLTDWLALMKIEAERKNDERCASSGTSKMSGWAAVSWVLTALNRLGAVVEDGLLNAQGPGQIGG